MIVSGLSVRVVTTSDHQASLQALTAVFTFWLL